MHNIHINQLDEALEVVFEDEQGSMTVVGTLTKRTQEIDDEEWYEGRVDTHEVMANDIEDLASYLKNKYNHSVVNY